VTDQALVLYSHQIQALVSSNSLGIHVSRHQIAEDSIYTMKINYTNLFVVAFAISLVIMVLNVQVYKRWEISLLAERQLSCLLPGLLVQCTVIRF
jgi:hypothetical protein